jgi:hypothetical protein
VLKARGIIVRATKSDFHRLKIVPPRVIRIFDRINKIHRMFLGT